MVDCFRRRSLTLSALDHLEKVIPPSSPSPKPSSPPFIPPSIMLPPSNYAQRQNVRYADSRGSMEMGEDTLTGLHADIGEFDVKLSSSLPTPRSVLEARFQRELENSCNFEEDGDFITLEDFDTISSKVEGLKLDDTTTLPNANTFVDANGNDSDANNPYFSDDDNYEYNTGENLADRFMYHYNFSGTVARAIGRRSNELALNAPSSTESATKDRRSIPFRNGFRRDETRRRRAFGGITQCTAASYSPQAASGSESAAANSSHTTNCTAKHEGDESNEAKNEGIGASSSSFFSTSPLLRFALEKTRINCFTEDFDEPPEFTLDVSY